jgi:hypothetical protein
MNVLWEEGKNEITSEDINFFDRATFLANPYGICRVRTARDLQTVQVRGLRKVRDQTKGGDAGRLF